MSAAAESKPEIRPLTGIRGFAAGLVLLNHFHPFWAIWLPALAFLNPMAGRGFLGVDLFFVLSGFILSYVYFEAAKPLGLAGYRQFVWHRLVRIWPVHFAMLALLAGLVLAARMLAVKITGYYPFSELPFQVAMVHIWPGVPGHSDTDPLNARAWNYPSWSISAEWFAYLLVFPVVWWLLKRLAGRGGVSMGLGCLLMAAWVLGWQVPGAYAVSRVTGEFITGALFFNVFCAAPRITRGCQRLATVTLLAIVAALLLCPENGGTWVILLFPFLVLGLTAETAAAARVFASAPALWLGRVSYSLYMTQSIPQKVMKLVAPPEHYAHASLAVRLALTAGALVLVLGFASAFYYLIENPARHYLRALVEKKEGVEK